MRVCDVGLELFCDVVMLPSHHCMLPDKGKQKRGGFGLLPDVKSTRPKSHQVRKRGVMKVEKYTKEVTVLPDKYSLKDPLPDGYTRQGLAFT